ncbi:MAG: BREX-6 system adenine-specific DNA-methyltransferase PglX [Deltaproteobacteria bacterium]|nr:BREX-6 system adenine-specific DNA-methyltransferase PglX [Deltaproteobacteria bacterium]
MTMTSEAKSLLSSTIRGLRERLLSELHSSVEGTYRMSLRARDAGLMEAARAKRRRLEAWIEEQVRIEAGGAKKGAADKDALRDRFRRDVEKQAAYTLLNRLILLRLMEARKLRSPEVVSRGWESAGYKAFRELAPALKDRESEGYAFLLQLVFDDMSMELPGLFSRTGVSELVPIPTGTLRVLVDALEDPGLASCWTDDMTLGWVYQYWNDPEREALDAKLNDGGKVEPHEIASKTQMFTERYMVDWLLQNSLGPMWLAMCGKHGWAPEVERDGVLAALEARRVEWRQKRDSGEVALTELMPLHSDVERRWAYYLPQPLPDDAVAHAPESVRSLKILDPAVGSGHFLVVAFDLLFALYQEEARHRGRSGDPEWQPRQIVESILENNLFGIDLDPRAVQIAAAALWLKAHEVARDAAPRRMNLVASALRLGGLSDDDPALVELKRQVEADTGIPGVLTETIVHALRGADHLGSLLKVDRAVDEALATFERGQPKADAPVQGVLFGSPKPQQLRMDLESARANVLDAIERFLEKHTRSDELGLRLHGEQLAIGVRFVRMVREGQYDLVVGNPPYQATADLNEADYVMSVYPVADRDLFAAFLLRCQNLVRAGGICALLTMRAWMFLPGYEALRRTLFRQSSLVAVGDFDRGAFEAVLDEVVAVAASVFGIHWRTEHGVALQPTPLDDVARDNERTARKRANTRLHIGRHRVDLSFVVGNEGHLVIYWWDLAQWERYARSPKLASSAFCREGVGTKNDPRYVRNWWEVRKVFACRFPQGGVPDAKEWRWIPFVKGAESKEWFEPLDTVIDWDRNGLQIATFDRSRYGRGAREYFKYGVAVRTIGRRFSARAHRYSSIFGHAGTSVFSSSLTVPELLCRMNRFEAQSFVSSISPAAGFKITDVRRMPLYDIGAEKAVFSIIDRAFSAAEIHRESSFEFRQPGPCPWRHAQQWAQQAVDRPENAPLPEYKEELDPEPPTDHLSFALGVALGRFGANGEGILDPQTADLTHTLPAGICFLDGTLETNDDRDSLGDKACKLLHEKWETYGPAIDKDTDLRTWLRTRFFPDVHKGMYENRPIHWPLSSKKKTYVAWVNIHRMNEGTLRTLRAKYLDPTKKRMDGELVDLRKARDGADAKAARAADKRMGDLQDAKEELDQFIKDVDACAERGAPPTDASCKPREREARYAPDLDDGVMINSAALWPLLDPQWNKPKSWWKELSNAQGKKDYDWSHLAMRHWPTRVDDKCKKDPSLGVAHGCFWRYHPARAFAWELRLQDEIGPDFRIAEKPYDPFGDGKETDDDKALRARFIDEHPTLALEAIEKEALRRYRKQKQPQAELRLLDPGLWSTLPAECWALELRVSEKQGAEFFLRAPDEAKVRKTFIKEHPAEVFSRSTLVSNLKPAEVVTDPDEEGEPSEEEEGEQALS